MVGCEGRSSSPQRELGLRLARGPMQLRRPGGTGRGCHHFIDSIYALFAASSPSVEGFDGSARLREPTRLRVTTVSDQCPCRACHLVGQRRHHHVQRSPGQLSFQPGTAVFRVEDHRRAPCINRVRMYGSARLLRCPIRTLPGGVHSISCAGDRPAGRGRGWLSGPGTRVCAFP